MRNTPTILIRLSLFSEMNDWTARLHGTCIANKATQRCDFASGHVLYTCLLLHHLLFSRLPFFCHSSHTLSSFANTSWLDLAHAPCALMDASDAAAQNSPLQLLSQLPWLSPHHPP